MKEIYRAENAFQLRLMQKFLEDHGIDAVILDEHSGTLMSGIGNILPRLMVLDEDAPRAQQLLQDNDAAFNSL